MIKVSQIVHEQLVRKNRFSNLFLICSKARGENNKKMVKEQTINKTARKNAKQTAP